MDRIISNKPISVLLIDDDEEDYIIIEHVFRRIPDSPFTLQWCSSYEEAKRLISEHAHDIYLVDYHLGKYSGLDLLKFADPQKRSEPFIMLTGTGGLETEKRSMQLAAADYLVKGTFGPELLSRTLNYSLGRKRNEQQRMEHLLALNRTKDEFISLASHQLRTPATGVKQYIGMVLEGFAGDITPMQRDLLKKAYASNDRQLRIVSNLLKVARIDAGKVILRKSEVDVGAMVGDVIKEQSETLNDRRQTVHFVSPQPPITAFIDGDRIRMVVENMLDNASKYSDIGKKIDVKLTETQTHVSIAIKDHGVGINEADQHKLFGKFSRIDNPLSIHVSGTGLGLYWAQKIVDLHGGLIIVKSKIGKGSTFVIHLPKRSRVTMLKEEQIGNDSDTQARKTMIEGDDNAENSI